MTLLLVLFVVAFVPMVLEAARSARNERALIRMGATEPRADVYRIMQLVYPACFLAMLAEAWLTHRRASAWVGAGAAVFAAAKALKYWAISALGVRWSFRVLVPPGLPMVRTGPYRVLRHPNYAAVLGELAGMALMAQAPIAGVLSLAAFAALIVARVRVEEKALGI